MVHLALVGLGSGVVLVARPIATAWALRMLLRERPSATLDEASDALAVAMRRRGSPAESASEQQDPAKRSFLLSNSQPRPTERADRLTSQRQEGLSPRTSAPRPASPQSAPPLPGFG